MTKTIVGITGGIGSGKSVVSRILNVMGYPVFTADEESKEVLDSDDHVREKVSALVGSESYRGDGKANRQYIASQVFQNPKKLEQLNAILHPAVRERFLLWTESQISDLVFKEAAILFESGSHLDTHAVIGVLAPEQERISRVMKRDGKTEKEVRAVMEQQMPQEALEKKCDYLIDNDGDHLVVPQVIEILKKLNGRKPGT